MTIYRDTALLYPPFRRVCDELAQKLIRSYEAGKTKTLFKVFETYRSPERQADLVAKRVSKAGPFESAHQFGLACDFVGWLSADEADALSTVSHERVMPGWSWNSRLDWQFLKKSAEEFGASVPIKWDLVHVEHPRWREFRPAWREHFDN